MKKVMAVFGTRPDAIKMCPLIIELKKHTGAIDTVVCVTGQHRQMLKQVLDFFDVTPDINLDIMREGQTLESITKSVIDGMEAVLSNERPALMLVHGDTTTAFASALAAFYKRIPVGHVEAGLRSHDMMSPYPEEFNRRATALVTDMHFAPTQWAADNLVKEGVDPKKVFVTGNTVVDAMKFTVSDHYDHELLRWAAGNRIILFTAHRRENFGQPLRNMFHAILRVVDEFPDVRVVYPVHYNPVVLDAAKEILGHHRRIRLTEPLGILDFHNIMAKAYLVLTDSGGVQEEASSINKPVLVMRETTERPEGIWAGGLRLVGTDEDAVYHNTVKLLLGADEYRKMAPRVNPYGDGLACKKNRRYTPQPHVARSTCA